ncbi:hypothetical protein M3090_01005 [Bacteroides sp. ET71]|uniref:hypothetical protein n=1 Tax=Bacteroides sp. ET71 TaxID=2939421 RepID=UPI0020135C5F|nr:hypothetical protein [Bacteroides sp. ET71]MCL1614990.1 hypothetical protein [Bacteroides sp. ET71]
MKSKFLLGALAFPLVFAACTNDEFEVNNAGQQAGLNGDVIELPDNFALTGAKGEDDANTRAGQINNRLGWLPTLKNDVGSDAQITIADLLLKENWDNIGLAWLNKVEDGQVYSNYKFTHYGWLATGATEVKTDPCNDNVMTNATWFDANKQQFEKWDVSGEDFTKVTAFDNAGAYSFEKSNFINAGVDANRGLFRTDLGTVFGGNYLVYYPFNEEMKDAGYLQAISDTEFKDAYQGGGKNVFMQALSPKHFMVGRTSISGGTQSAEFTLQRLTGAIAIQLQNYGSEIKDIESVVLYANGGNFYTSVGLDAAKINGQAITNVNGLYVENPETTQTSKLLVSRVTTPIAIPAANAYGPGTAVFAFVALPVSFDGYTIVVQDKDGNSWAKKFDETLTVPAGGCSSYWFTRSVAIQAPSADNLYAYDEASFKLAVEKAKSAKTTQSTIHLLGTIELTESVSVSGNVTIQAETADDKLVLTRQEDKAVNLWIMKGATVNCDVEIQGQGCCGLKPATMDMNGSLGKDYTITNYGSKITFGKGTSTSNRVQSEINGTILNIIDPDNEDPETNKPEIVVNAYTTLDLKGSLTNKGYITVETAGTDKSGDDGTLNVYNGATLTNEHFVTIEGNMATQGNAFTNKSGATFTVKVGAQITGKGVVNEDGGEYICEVNSERRYLDAINNAQDAIHSTTLVRFIDTTPAVDQTYVLKGNTADNSITNKNGQVINFESDLDAAKNLTLEHELDASSEPIPATIGKLTIVNGGFQMDHAALTMGELEINRENEAQRWTRFNETLIVTGDVNIVKNNHGAAGEDDIKFVKGVNIGGDMNVLDMGDEEVIFPEGIESNIGGTLKVDQAIATFEKATTNNIGVNMVVTEMGKASFAANSITTIQQTFENDGVVNIMPQTMVGNGEVAARVICRSFTNFGDKSHWLNGSYPQDTLGD